MIYEERDYRIKAGKLGEFVSILAPVAYSPLQ